MTTIEVLLATYNGERFLCEQVDSILAQQLPADVELRILARDDGSRDGTRAILEQYASRESGRFCLLPASAPTGHAKFNFARLMAAATAPYVCLCDQDDVWLPGKVARSLAAMRVLEANLEARHGNTHGNMPGKTLPLLVFSDLRVVGQKLDTIAPSFWAQMGLDPESAHSLSRSLVQDSFTGCTGMLNRELCGWGARLPPEAPMHDRWLMLVVAAMGASHALAEPTVLYRQHEDNVVGARAEDVSAMGLVQRTASGSGRTQQWVISHRLASAFERLAGEGLPAKSRATLELFRRSGEASTGIARVAALLRGGFRRNGLLRNVSMVVEAFKTRVSSGD
jgi:hypothetical protein